MRIKCKSHQIAILAAVIIPLVLITALPVAFGQQSDLDRFQSALAQAKSAYSKIGSYTFHAHLKELNKGKPKELEIVHSEFIKNPRRIYFRWEAGSLFEGLQASHVLDRDGADKFQGLETGVRGLPGVITWKLDSPIIAKLYPHQFLLSQYHMGFIISHIENVTGKAQKDGALSVVFDGTKSLDKSGRVLDMYKLELSKGAGSGKYKKGTVGFDQKTKLPLYLEIFDHQGRLFARYDIKKFAPNAKVDTAVFTLKKD